jgi:hypothetical protein
MDLLQLMSKDFVYFEADTLEAGRLRHMQTVLVVLAPVGQALDTAARSTLNAIIYHTAQPVLSVSLGSVVHAAVYHDWDTIKS